MMEEMYGFSSSASDHHHHHHHYPNHFPVIPQPEDYAFAAEAAAAAAFPSSAAVASDAASMVVPEARRCGGGGGAVTAEEEISAVIRARIASHPLYPKLLQAYIDCQKVGAPPEVAGLLEDIQRDNNLCSRAAVSSSSSSLGADPELDDFMEAYCDVLAKYRSDLSRPFDEATTFLNNIESQLNNLCASRTHISDEAVGSSEEEFSGGEVEVQDCSRTGEDRELKDKLLRKYSGYISTLKLEFSKKKKKGKLPKEARQTLLDWWNVHYKWPYPTEADKVALAEVTGLDQKQINNWFINQRKRHWKPSENMQFAVMDSVYGQPYFSNN